MVIKFNKAKMLGYINAIIAIEALSAIIYGLFYELYKKFQAYAILIFSAPILSICLSGAAIYSYSSKKYSCEDIAKIVTFSTLIGSFVLGSYVTSYLLNDLHPAIALISILSFTLISSLSAGASLCFDIYSNNEISLRTKNLGRTVIFSLDQSLCSIVHFLLENNFRKTPINLILLSSVLMPSIIGCIAIVSSDNTRETEPLIEKDQHKFVDSVIKQPQSEQQLMA